MHPLFSFVRVNFRTLLLCLLIANAIIINIMGRHNELLRSKQTPAGIVSLELNASPGKQDAIIERWKAVSARHYVRTKDAVRHISVTGIDVARRHTRADYVFILLYGMLLAAAVTRFFPDRAVRFGVAAVVLAGLMDGIENGFILQALKGIATPPLLIFLPAVVKFALLLLLIIGLIVFIIRGRHVRKLLIEASGYLNLVLAILWRFRIVVIGLLILFAALWLSDQGMDLLLIINSEPLGPVLFIFITTILALLNWYFPKYYDGGQPGQYFVPQLFQRQLVL